MIKIPSSSNIPFKKARWITLKKAPLYFLPPFLLGGFIVLILHSNEVREETLVAKTQQVLQMDLLIQEISHAMRNVASDAKVAASHHELEAALEPGDSPRLEPLIREFSAFSEWKGAYDQIRLISLSGKELINVSYVNDQVIIPPEASQDMRQLRYFNDILDLSKEEIYLSPITIDAERDGMEQPPKPVMRVGMPFFDQQDQKKGIVVLNYLIQEISRYLVQNTSPGGMQYLLLGSDDFWLQGPGEKGGWTFFYQSESNPPFSERYLGIWKRISDFDSGQFFSQEGLVTHAAVYPRLEAMQELSPQISAQRKRRADLSAEPLSWKVISIVPKEMLFVGSSKRLGRHLLFYGLFSLVLGISSVALAKTASRRKLAEEALSLSEEQHRQLVETTPHGIEEIDLAGKIIFGNRAYHRMLGYGERGLIGKTIWDLIPKKDLAHAKSSLAARVAKRIKPSADVYQHIRKDGGVIDVEVAWNYKQNAEGAVVGFISVITDITERRRAEERQRLASTVFETATEGIVVTDADVNIISINPAFTEITGYALEDVFGKNPRILRSSQSGRHDKAFYKAMWISINTTGYWQGEIWNRRKNGEVYPEWLSITAVKDRDGSVRQYTGLFIDITQRKEYEERLRFQAYFDPLTRLPNRMLLFDRLSQGVKQAERNQRKAALLFVDLDGFKHVNDTLGHLAGDDILKQAANRLLASVRKTDTVARSGGDEFLIILSDIEGRKDASIASEKIIEALSHPFQFERQEVFVGASIGVTMVPDDAQDSTALLKNADMAMYKAKNEGRNTYRFFSEKMEKVAHARTLLEWDLRRALESQEMTVYYQPIIDLSSLKTISLEALIRWNHPQQGMLYPEQFIPLAEESGVIVAIGNWVLQTACHQLAKWRKQFDLKTSISVNMSSRQFMYDDFFSAVNSALEQTRLPAKCLTIEITESLMLNPHKDVLEKLWALKELGIQLSIDDFGTGYSSLSYLSKYPLNLLKIDKSFVLNVKSDVQKQPLVEAIIRMGHSMALKVIAEGVERHDDLLYLKEQRCDAVQGHYFSEPLPAKAYEAVLEKQLKGA